MKSCSKKLSAFVLLTSRCAPGMSIKKYKIPVLLPLAHQGVQNTPEGWKFVHFSRLASESGGTAQLCVTSSKIVEIIGEAAGKRVRAVSVCSLRARPFLVLFSMCADGARGGWYWGKPSSLSFSLCNKSFGVIKWGALREMWRVGQGRFSFLSALSWGGPICSAVSSSGLPSSRKMRSCWREARGGLRG